jgi:hypothetical protein
MYIAFDFLKIYNSRVIFENEDPDQTKQFQGSGSATLIEKYYIVICNSEKKIL